MPLYPQTPRQHPGFLSGRTYPLYRGTTAALAVAAIDTIYIHPFILPANMNFTAGVIRVTTGGAGSSAKGAIWANSPVSNRPLGAPLYVDNTGVATTSSSANATLAFGAGSLSGGVLYWYGTKYTGTLPSVLASAASTLEEFLWLAGNAATPNMAVGCISYADAYSNNMPTIAEGSGTITMASNVCPVVGLTT